MKTVFVMLSGGVDSSVAAATLKEQGYNVVGVFMKCWSMEQLQSMGVSEELYGCFWEEDSRDARLVADTLQIPFYVWNFEVEYKQGVVDYMIEAYKNGYTPNPDVMCNSVIKFGIFYHRAVRLGADYVATGHYARVTRKNTIISLQRGKDYRKDQSYFLWRVPEECLRHTFMPIGEYTSKQVVRQKATDLNLITAQKKDSQGLCFVGDIPISRLLLQTIGEKEGSIVDFKTGNVLGDHAGAYQFTIGQRHNLKLPGGPWYVHSIDVLTNTVFVVHGDYEKEIFSDNLKVSGYWIKDEYLNNPQLEAQIRYRQSPQKCVATKEADGLLKVEFQNPVRAVAKGQSIVFYHGSFLVGGGVII